MWLLGGCQSGGDAVHVGFATGMFQKWETADCTCEIDRSLQAAFGGDSRPLVRLTATFSVEDVP